MKRCLWCNKEIEGTGIATPDNRGVVCGDNCQNERQQYLKDRGLE